MSERVHEPGVYWRLDEPTILRLLQSEGWDPVLVRDEPGHVYPPHRHEAAKALAILHGGMEVKVDGTLYRLVAGDRLCIRSGQEHMAVVGPDGCLFFWSERVCD